MPRIRLTQFLASLALALAHPLAAAETGPFPSIPPKSPAEALASFQIQGGFRMELLASEPLVTDPVDMAYDENGRAYVVEMSDYPYTDPKTHQAWKDNTTDAPIGRVRILEDLDGDWKFDRGTIFADKLSWPTGIACWKGGVFVLATPDIWYFKDTDGDRKADIRKKVFTGFRKYNVQAVMNNPTWGLDHRLYIAGSSNGGSVRPGAEADAKPDVLRRNDFSIHPITGDFDVLAGGARFGNTFDDWGNRFICNIRNPVQHALLPNRYLARNKFLPVASAIHDVAESGDRVPVYPISPPEPWREYRARQWATAMDRQYPRSELAPQGYFTSSSGLTIYRGSAYPKSFYGNVFIGEVANNLTHRQILKPDGVTFKSTPAHDKVEFLASTDNWFRPVNYINAPDGTLHILDMYRENIEHPWSIPDEIRARLDLESGRDRGRIYRLLPPGEFKPGKPPRLGEATTEQLVELLAHPNSWQRETAHRLIYERQPRGAARLLRELLRSQGSPIARLHALHSLNGLEALDENDLLTGLAAANPGLREHALKLAEPWFHRSVEIQKKALSLAEDGADRVRFQASFSLGQIVKTNMPAAFALAGIMRRATNAPAIQTAVLSSATGERAFGIFVNLLVPSAHNPATPEQAGNLRLLAEQIGVQGASTQDIIDTTFKLLSIEAYIPEEVRDNILIGFNAGLKRSGSALQTVAASRKETAEFLAKTITGARNRASDASERLNRRRQSIELLTLEPFDSAAPALGDLLTSQQSSELQSAAIQALAGYPDNKVAGVILKPWRLYTPPVRDSALASLMARPNRVGPLLDAIESGVIPQPQISAARRALLLRNRDPKLRQRAVKIFAEEALSPRKEVIDDYQAALALKGDRPRGKKVYEAACMACHRFAGQGNEIGPDLSTVANRTSDEILVHIVDPNREVSPNFIQYDIDLKSDESVTGVIVEETANSIAIKTATNERRAILRADIQELRSSGLSLMPEGLEAAIDKQAMADLLAYLLKR